MENISEEQRQQILRKRQEMLKKMGVPAAGKMVNESVVNTGSASGSMAQKLAAIKNGAAKAELNKYLTATSNGANGGFQGIPEKKQKRGPAQEVKPEFKQELQDFGAPAANSHELSAIDSMFGGDGPVRMSSGGGQVAQGPMHTELDIDSIVMPSFNPHAALQQKARESQNNSPSPYLKYASNTQPVQNEQFVEVGAPVGQPQFNTQQLQMMMETIAKGIAEKTIRSVLNEYSEQQKNKNYFEYYNKEKNIIKTPDGKYYRLTQVEFKKK